MVRFDRYRVDGKVGAGGLADVFRASLIEGEVGPEALEEGQVVALKVLRDPARSPASLRRFLREGELLKSLRHPGLPRCYEVVEGARPFLVLELLEGESLSEALKRGPMHPDDLLKVAKSLLKTIAWLHARGVVHRDVKSANVFLCADGRVLLVDLGMATRRREERGPGGVMGTYAYMAPEQISGAAVDQRTDLYALGVTLYESLAGLRPYRARGPAGYLEAHLRAEPRRPLPPQTPQRLAEVVKALMARDPAHRPQTASLALSQLTGVQSWSGDLLGPPLVGREAPLGAIEAILDQGFGAVHLVGEQGSGLGRMAREAWRMAKERGLRVRGLRLSGQGNLGAVLAQPADLLVVEDLHRSSAAELQLLAQATESCALLTTGSLEPRMQAGRIIPMRDLRVEEVQELISGVLGTPQIPPGQTEKLSTFTRGLPGAVVSTLRDFAARGALRRTGVGPGGYPNWRMNDAVRMGRDNSLNKLYRRRLESLDLDARALLEVLAVAREPVPVSVAEAVSGVAPGGNGVWRLLQDHLARRRRAGKREALQIARPALAALVGRELSQERRRSVLQGILRSLAELGSPPETSPLQAWCEAHGAEQDKLAETLVRLGERLVRRGRTPLAHEIIVRASYTQPMTPSVAVRVALARARCLMAEARPDEAWQALEAASNLIDGKRSDSLALAHAQLCLHRGALSDAEGYANAAIESRRTRAIHEGRLILAEVRGLQGRRKAAAHHCQEVLTVANEGSVGARAHAQVGWLLLSAGRLGDAARHLRMAARWHRRVRSPQVVDSLLGLAEALSRAGASDDAYTALSAAQRAASNGGLYPLRVRVAAARARFALHVSGPVAATTLLKSCPLNEGDEVSLRIRGEWGLSEVLVRLASKDHAAALAACNRVREDTELAGWAELSAFAQGLEAVLRGQGEDLLGAVRRLDQLGARLSLARLLLAAGQVEKDPAVLKMAVPEARRAQDAFLLLECLRAVGTPEALEEAQPLARRVMAGASGTTRERLRGRSEVAWALTRPDPRPKTNVGLPRGGGLVEAG